MTTPIFLKLLAIDDNADNLELIASALQREELKILTSQDPEEGLQIFLRERPRIVLLDLVMPKVSGMEILEKIVNVDPGAEVILITAHYSTESAVEAIQKGASDYLTKPLDIQRLRSRIDSLLADAENRQKSLRLDQELIDAYQFEGMVGRSPLMLEVYARIRRIAPHFHTVLVTGATGTGKELVARALHRLVRRHAGRLWYATVPLWSRTWWKASCLDSYEGPSPEPTATRLGCSNMPMAGRYSWMKSESSPLRRKPNS